MTSRQKIGLVVALSTIAALCLAFTFLRRKEMTPEKTEYLGALSGYFVKDALRSIKEGTSWVPAPFCMNLSRQGVIHEVPDCEAFYKKHRRYPACSLQNLGAKDWDPAVIQLDPKVVAKETAHAMKMRGCEWLILDIESLRGKDRARFTAWSQDLVGELRRRIPKLHTSIAVHAKVDAKGDWGGAEAQDWEALCQIYDELLIMAYDFNYPGSTRPGETAPLDWVEKVIKYGLTACPKEHFRLGLAAYGYRWPKNETVTERQWRVTRDPRFFVETGEKRQQKIDLGRRYGINRFFLWAMGME